MKKINKLMTIAAFLTTYSTTALAITSSVALGPKLGTQGIGVELRAPLAENFFGRISGNYFKMKKEYGNSDLKLNGEFTLLSVPIMLDWHPIDDSGFRLSAGVAYNGNQLKATAKPMRNTVMGGKNFTPAELGTITTKLTLGSAIAGIVSVGYDNSFKNNSPWSFNCEAGAMYTGNPKLSISSTGTGGAIAAQHIKKDAERNFNKTKKFLQVFPILSLGFKYSL
jgi:hypothetical protein